MPSSVDWNRVSKGRKPKPSEVRNYLGSKKLPYTPLARDYVGNSQQQKAELARKVRKFDIPKGRRML